MQTPCQSLSDIESISFVCALAAAAQSSCELHFTCSPVFPSAAEAKFSGAGLSDNNFPRVNDTHFPFVLIYFSGPSTVTFVSAPCGRASFTRALRKGILLIRDAIHAMISSIKDGPRRTPKLCLSSDISF